MLEIKNVVVVVICIFIKYNGLCGGLADSNYFYAEDQNHARIFVYVKRILRARYVHDRNRARNLLRPDT